MPEPENKLVKVPNTWEYLIKKSSIDPQFRKEFLLKRGKIADELQLPISEQERTMLDSVTEAQLQAIIDRVRVTPAERSGLSLGCFLGLITGGLILGAMAVPNFQKARGHTIESPATCRSHLRLMISTIEMYNMDHSPMVRAITDANREQCQNAMKSYVNIRMETLFRCPGTGTFYTLENLDQKEASRIIRCPVHGPLP